MLNFFLHLTRPAQGKSQPLTQRSSRGCTDAAGFSLPAAITRGSLWLLGPMFIACLPSGIWRVNLMCWCLSRPHNHCHLLLAVTMPLSCGHRCCHLHPQQPQLLSQLQGRASHCPCCLGHPSFSDVKPEELPQGQTSFEGNVEYFKPDS